MSKVLKYSFAFALFAGMFSYAYATGTNHNVYTNYSTDNTHYTTWNQNQQQGTSSNAVAQSCGWASTTCTMGVNIYCPASITCTDIPPVDVCLGCGNTWNGATRINLQNTNSQPNPAKAFNFSIGGQENTPMTFFFSIENTSNFTLYGLELAVKDADDPHVMLVFDPNNHLQPVWWWSKNQGVDNTYSSFNPLAYNLNYNGGAYWSWNTSTNSQIQALGIEDSQNDPITDHECISAGTTGALNILYAPTAIVITPGAQAGPHFFDVSFGVRFDYGY